MIALAIVSPASMALTQNGAMLTEQYGKSGPAGGFRVKVTTNWAAGPSSAWRQGAMGTTEFYCAVRTGLSTVGNRDYCHKVVETFRTGGYDQNSNTHINVWCQYWDPIAGDCNADDSPPMMTHEEKQQIWDAMHGDMTEAFIGGANDLQYQIDRGNAGFKDRLERSIQVSYLDVAESEHKWKIFPPDKPGTYRGTLTVDMPVQDYTVGGQGYMIIAIHSIEVIDW